MVWGSGVGEERVREALLRFGVGEVGREPRWGVAPLPRRQALQGLALAAGVVLAGHRSSPWCLRLW